ncbi:DUF3703 domain-containing protein [Alicycliphilus denitrificans]|uniref:DUF3703 domain-containing protein n=1 Tax=Alicycliphilus denitrificans TaxID=179636 RepID=UPI00384F302E
MSQTRQRAAFNYLLQQFAASAGQGPAQRWRYLEAAHVLGQNRLGLHLRAHWQMLRFAQALGDKFEVTGQLRHLCMAPVGHLVRRMPYGNNGRAIAAPLQPMVPSALLRACIAEAMQASGAAATENPAAKP